jgi:hypothetical protein
MGYISCKDDPMASSLCILILFDNFYMGTNLDRNVGIAARQPDPYSKIVRTFFYSIKYFVRPMQRVLKYL